MLTTRPTRARRQANLRLAAWGVVTVAVVALLGASVPGAEHSPSPTVDAVRRTVAEREAAWKPAFARYRERYEETMRAYERKLAVLRDYRARCGYRRNERRAPNPRHPDRPGLLYEAWILARRSCARVERDIRELDDEGIRELRAIQKRCYDDATTRGIPPGRARLLR